MTKKSFSKDLILLDNVENVVHDIASKLRTDILHNLRRTGGVIGLSGGIDSSVTLALTVKALGPDRKSVV